MGLNERRKIKQIQEELVPAVTEELKTVSGGSVFTWSFNWEVLGESLDALNSLEYSGLRKVAEAIEGIAIDQMGKDALSKGLKQIEIIHVPGMDKSEYAFTDGKLTMRSEFISSGWNMPKSEDIQALLESKL